MWSATESRCSARDIPQNMVGSFQRNSAVDSSTCWLCSTTKADLTLAPLELDLVQTLSAVKDGAHRLQQSSTLAIAIGLVVEDLLQAATAGFLSKLTEGKPAQAASCCFQCNHFQEAHT